MPSNISSFLPRDETLGRKLLSFDNNIESSDTLSLKSCPALRPRKTQLKGTTISYKPKYVSSSSLLDIREGHHVQSVQRKHNDPADKPLTEGVKRLIENEWKRRTRHNAATLAALHMLAKRQQTEENNFGRAEQATSSEVNLRTAPSVHSSDVPKNVTKSSDGVEKRHTKKLSVNDGSKIKSQQARDIVSLSSRSCTVFSGKRVTQSYRQDDLARSSRSIHDDVADTAHVTDTPALGVQELRRRFSVRLTTTNGTKENNRRCLSKLTQTSFPDAWPSETRLPPRHLAEFREQHPCDSTQTLQRNWNTGVAEIDITKAAEGLVVEREAGEVPLTGRQVDTASSGSIFVDGVSISSEDLRACFATQFGKCAVAVGGPDPPNYASQTFPADIILPPPPEFYQDLPHEKPANECVGRPLSPKQQEPVGRPPSAAQQEPHPEDLSTGSIKAKLRRPVPAQASSRTTRDRCTQTVPGTRPACRRSRRVTYSPSEVSGPSDRSEDQRSLRSGPTAGRGLWLRRRRRKRRNSQWRRTSSGREESPRRTAGSRPMSGRSSQLAAGARPLSGRSLTAAAGGTGPGPTLMDEVLRRARTPRKVAAIKGRKSKRKAVEAQKNTPEAIARFLGHLSRNKEVIRVIHKMSLVVNKK